MFKFYDKCIHLLYFQEEKSIFVLFGQVLKFSRSRTKSATLASTVHSVPTVHCTTHLNRKWRWNTLLTLSLLIFLLLLLSLLLLLLLRVAVLRGQGTDNIHIKVIKPVLRIRIRMDPEFLPGSGSRIIVPDLDPAKNERR